MIAQPDGWLSRACEIVRGRGTLLIADEVMTGFGRSGSGRSPEFSSPNPISGTNPGHLAWSSSLFACGHENVQPDLLALAKGLTGGYLPMAATLTSQPIFDAFLGEYEEFKTFFHGHSFTGNQLGAAAARASLSLLQEPASIEARLRLEQALRRQLQQLWRQPHVGDIRQVGLMAGVELVEDWRTRKPFDLRQRGGMRVCTAMARRGVLTRSIGNIVVIMPPYCTTARQLSRMIEALSQSIAEQLE
jgi:adenosylmethionine-8-amino-7-oxononanoate aminotransferase